MPPTRRWITAEGAYRVVPEVDNFLMSIGHEDDHGAFQVHEYSPDLTEWLLNADDARPRDDKRGGSA